ncbi:hypothetical protein VSR82_07825 [Burkholderia sp. JPY481]
MDAESQFQGLWDSGAFDPKGIPPREEGGQDHQQQQSQQQGSQEGAQDDGAQRKGQENVEGQEGQEGQQQRQQDDNNTPTYSSLSELLTAHKIDPESVMGLHVTAKIDGKETQVPLADVLKSYQLEGHVNNKSIELSNLRTSFEKEQTEWRQAQEQVYRQHQAMGNLALNMLNQEFQNVDWNALRANNPGEYAALYTQYQQRGQQIQNYLAAINEAQRQEAQQQQQRQQQEMQQALQGEREKLFTAIPEWRNEATFHQDRDVMSQYARSLGFKDAELNQIYDHRYMQVLHDAARYRALQAAKPEVLKQVRQAPKVVAPGSRTNANPNDARRQAVIDRFNRNPRDDDAAAALFDMIG